MYRKKLMAFCLFMSSGSAFAGHIQDATFHSAALNAPLPVNIYRPEGPPPENG
ncbi:MAG: esterase family protein, partial [Rhizobium oryzihabitans]